MSGAVTLPFKRISLTTTNVVFVDKSGSDTLGDGSIANPYRTVVKALTTITTATNSNRFLIHVGAGEFFESQIVMKQFVSLQGSGINVTTIRPSSVIQNLIVMNIMSEISFLSLIGDVGSIGSGKSAIYGEDIGDFGQVHKVSIYDFDIGIENKSVLGTSILYIEYTDINGNFINAAKNTASGGQISKLQLENFYTYPSGNVGAVKHIESSGTAALLIVNSAGIQGGVGNTGISISNGGAAKISDILIEGFGIGVHAPNIGAASDININSAQLTLNTLDFKIDHPIVNVKFQGVASHLKIINSSANINWVFLDHDDGDIEITRKLAITFPSGSHTDLSTLLVESGAVGVLSGGDLIPMGVFNLKVTAGYGYLENVINEIKRVDWVEVTLVLPASSTRYIYIDKNAVVSLSATMPNIDAVIFLGRAVTSDLGLLIVDKSQVNSYRVTNDFYRFLREGLGAIYKSGSLVSENGVRGLSVTAGKYFFGAVPFSPSGGAPIAWDAFSHDGLGNFVRAAQSVVDNASYDSGLGLVAITAGFFVKHSLYVVGDGVNEKYLLVYAQAQYSSLVLAEPAALPLPPSYFIEGVAPIASIIVQQGVANIVQIRDERPIPGSKASAQSSTSSHSALLNLDVVADHPGYLTLNGARAMLAALNMGTFDITNVGLVDGVDVSLHKARHDFNGADPLLSGVPSAIGTASAEGVNNTQIPRIDHVHAHGDLIGGTLHAVVTTLVNGFMSFVDKTKLDGVATGATANSTDAFLLARANHTGTQLAATISDFSATVLATLLTGFGGGAAGIITAADNVLGAFVRLQNQIINNLTTLSNHIANTANPHATTAAQVGAEPTITGTTSADFWSGAKTFINFATTVRATVLTGLSLATGTAITAADSVLSALEKLQVQITNNLATLTAHIGSGGTAHSAASGASAGFMSVADKNKLDGIVLTVGTAQILTLATNQSSTSATYADLSGFSVVLATGIYEFSFYGKYQSSSAGNGIGVRITNLTSTLINVIAQWITNSSANGSGVVFNQLTPGSNHTTPTTNVANTDDGLIGVGTFEVSIAGTISFQLRSEATGTAVTVIAGSRAVIRKVV